jgi:pimeloyl-ACP methyl ester carboxylesterase
LFQLGNRDNNGPRTVGIEPVTFLTDDGVAIWGTLFSESARWVLLVHDRDHDLDSYFSLSSRLVADGFSVLAFDLRGCGLSGGRQSVSKFHLDVLAAARLARQRGAGEIFAIGAGRGSGVVIEAAPDANFGAAVLLSPSLDRRRRVLTTAVRRSTVPKLVLVGSQDADAFRAARDVMATAVGPRVIVALPTQDQSHQLLGGTCAVQVMSHTSTFLAHNRSQLEPVPTSI